MRTKTCDNDHQAITFSYISELEECPICKIIRKHGWEIRDLNKEHEEGLEKPYKEIGNLKRIIQISHQEITRLEKRKQWNV